MSYAPVKSKFAQIDHFVPPVLAIFSTLGLLSLKKKENLLLPAHPLVANPLVSEKHLCQDLIESHRM